MKEEIRERALALGFDLVGFTTADPPLHAAEYRHWLADGFHGEMGYMARRTEERAEPARILPGARSVIVVGLNYNSIERGSGLSAATAGQTVIARNAGTIPPQSPVTNHQSPITPRSRGAKAAPTLGKIARYAWGPRDYHDLLGEKLAQLTAFIVSRGGRAKGYVDTGPVLERDLAQRAGIGFIGKHTNLINRSLGNWILLGEVITDLDLPPDPPEQPHCGTCHRCLDACPTRAIVSPYRLDARLCISYLTIELKGVIPVELRPLIGDRIFGCDDCLAVCPWNRFAKLSLVKEFQRRDLPPLTEFLSWDDAKFTGNFQGTPLARLQRGRFLRNVCVALGNSGGRAALPALQRAARDPDPLVREHAAWAISVVAAD